MSLEKLAARTGVADVDEAMARLTAGAARQPACADSAVQASLPLLAQCRTEATQQDSCYCLPAEPHAVSAQHISRLPCKWLQRLVACCMASLSEKPQMSLVSWLLSLHVLLAADVIGEVAFSTKMGALEVVQQQDRGYKFVPHAYLQV